MIGEGDYSEAFYIAIAGMVFAFLGVCIKSCQASKCDQINLCWGCIRVHRNVEAEIDAEKDIEMSSIQPRQQQQHILPPGDPLTNTLTNIGTNLATGAATHLVHSVREMGGRRESGKVEATTAAPPAAEEKAWYKIEI